MRVLVKVRRHRWCSHQAVHDGRTRNNWMADTRRSEADYIETVNGENEYAREMEKKEEGQKKERSEKGAEEVLVGRKKRKRSGAGAGGERDRVRRP